MACGNTDDLCRQASFEFAVSASGEAASPCLAGAPKVVATIAAPALSSTVVRLVDHQRTRHLEVVRRLLTETGVFRIR